ncbi:hypothetical protein CR513_24728, partial [Mucuna pruriens]
MGRLKVRVLMESTLPLVKSRALVMILTMRESCYWCFVLGNLCSMIIDGGICVNVATERLVEKLVLPMFAHPRSYKRPT